MWGKAGAACLVAALAACAGPQGPPPPASAGASAVGAIGTPFLIAFKLPVCVVTVVLAAPLAGATGLAYSDESREIRRDLDQGVAQNCGPPYALGTN